MEMSNLFGRDLIHPLYQLYNSITAIVLDAPGFWMDVVGATTVDVVMADEVGILLTDVVGLKELCHGIFIHFADVKKIIFSLKETSQ